MSCYRPIIAYRSREIKKETGKRPLVFSRSSGYVDMEVKIPCGQCIGCKLEKSRQWAMRIMHESKMYENNCFITLTYSNENLPKDNSLVLEDLQKFFKRLRKKLGDKIRYYACGEYGEKFKRPHYHICLFNIDFKDKELIKSGDYKLYRSSELEKLWQYGYSVIGSLTFDSAAYVARYVTKKITGDMAEDHYKVVDLDSGEIRYRKKEFAVMSRRPGVGRSFYEKYSSDIYNYDLVIVNGKKMRPPKYYDKRFEVDNPEDMEKLKIERKLLIKNLEGDNTFDRLLVKESVKSKQTKILQRSYENEKSSLCL